MLKYQTLSMPLSNTLNPIKLTVFRAVYGLGCFAMLLSFLSFNPAIAQEKLALSIAEAETMHQEGKRSQQKINNTLDQSEVLLEEHKKLSLALEQLNINFSHSQKIRQQQDIHKASLKDQLLQVSKTENNIIPLLLSMIDWLELTIQKDLPFHLTERNARLTTLKQTLLSPEIELAEQYRQVLDTYQIESEFGYTIESYQESIQVNGQAIRVDLLRVGRVGLYFQRLDGLAGGFWNKSLQRWNEIDPENLKDIQQGILIAKKQRPHSLLTLPVSINTVHSSMVRTEGAE